MTEERKGEKEEGERARKGGRNIRGRADEKRNKNRDGKTCKKSAQKKE